MNTLNEKNTLDNNTASDNSIPLSILFIMDSSGSMVAMGDEPLQGLNDFYKKQNETGNFMSTLCFFSSDVKFIHKNISGKDIPILTNNDYNPNGMTALYDAIGESVNYQLEQNPKNVLVVILTDGEENASSKYTKKDIKKLLEKMETENGWKIMYLGANQDSFKVANGIGINNSSNYDHTPDGCSGLFRRLSQEVSRCVSEESPNNLKSLNLQTGDDFEIISPPRLKRTDTSPPTY